MRKILDISLQGRKREASEATTWTWRHSLTPSFCGHPPPADTIIAIGHVFVNLTQKVRQNLVPKLVPNRAVVKLKEARLTPALKIFLKFFKFIFFTPKFNLLWLFCFPSYELIFSEICVWVWNVHFRSFSNKCGVTGVHVPDYPLVPNWIHDKVFGTVSQVRDQCTPRGYPRDSKVIRKAPEMNVSDPDLDPESFRSVLRSNLIIFRRYTSFFSKKKSLIFGSFPPCFCNLIIYTQNSFFCWKNLRNEVFTTSTYS